jgi:hypothetical protein
VRQVPGKAEKTAREASLLVINRDDYGKFWRELLSMHDHSTSA